MLTRGKKLRLGTLFQSRADLMAVNVESSAKQRRLAHSRMNIYLYL